MNPNKPEHINALEQLAYLCHQNSVLHGFYEGEDCKSVPTKIALMHSELSEMLEGHRRGTHNRPDEHCPEFTNEEIEAADVLIRLFDFAGWRGLRIGQATIAKMTYNEGRPFKHSKSF